MAAEEGTSRKPFRCRAEHPRGGAEATVTNPGSAPPLPPSVTLYPPSREDFQGPFRNSTLLCRVRGPRRAPVRWLRNGLLLLEGVATETAPEASGTFVTSSRVTVTEAEWDRGDTFTCQAEQETRNTSKGLECGYEPPMAGGDIHVETLAPSFADIFTAKAAKLTCKVSNLGGAEGLEVTWLSPAGDKLSTKTAPPVLQPNGLLGASAVTSVCAEDWEEGQEFTCRVVHPDLLFPREVKLKKSPVAGAKPPAIFLFPPPAEQLRLQQAATLTCLARAFNPPDLFIHWLRNGEPLPPQAAILTFPPRPEPAAADAFTAVSALTVPGADWEGGAVFTCLVGHERLPLQVAQKSIDKASGKAAPVNVSLVLADGAGACY